MPAPATADEFLDLIRRSGVADEPRLKAYVKKLSESPGGVPADPQKLAVSLVRDGVLTVFQAEQLLQGKYKRFTIGKYKVLEKLGAGGMAQVFLCEHKLMRRRVAIKVLPTAKADDPSSLERFYREARAVAALDHPNIVRAYDIDQDENLHFLVMEYVDGTNLQDLVKKFGPLDVLRACHYIYGAAVGLQHAHEMGLVHRDIKPGNILLDRSGVVKILDMGLARFFHDEQDELTKKYDENVLGTADYLAPEQALDSHAVDIRADVYSLGATFYFLLTGSPPFPEGSVAQKLIWHQNRAPRPVKMLRPDAPDEVVAVVEKMMAKKTEARYQTPAEVIAALAGWVATPIPPPSEKEMPQVSLAAGGLGVRGPATMAAPTQPSPTAPAAFTRAGAPAAPAGVTTPPPAAPPARPAPPPAPALALDPVNPAVWESLGTDTNPLARGDTDRPSPRADRSPSSARRRAAAPKAAAGGSKKLLLAAGGALLLIAVVVGLYLAFFAKTEPTPVPPAPGGPQRITVGDGENAVPTLRDALSKAGPGDTIVIAKSPLVEHGLRLVRAQHKGLTIEGALPGGARPVVEAAASVRGAVLEALDVEGVRLRNVEFDCRGVADVGVQVSGTCPGFAAENVVVRNAGAAGFGLSNAAGGEGTRAILLDRVRTVSAVPNHAGLLITSGKVGTRHVAVRRCRFEGLPDRAGGTGVRVEGETTDVAVTGSRFFALDAAFLFVRPPADKTMRAVASENTVYQAKAGLHFDPGPPREKDDPPPGKFELTVAQNYFAKTVEIGKWTGVASVPKVTALANAHSPECGAGNVDLKLTRLDTPQLSKFDPADDATFLRFPGGPPPVVGGKKVGAN